MWCNWGEGLSGDRKWRSTSLCTVRVSASSSLLVRRRLGFGSVKRSSLPCWNTAGRSRPAAVWSAAGGRRPRCCRDTRLPASSGQPGRTHTGVQGNVFCTGYLWFHLQASDQLSEALKRSKSDSLNPFTANRNGRCSLVNRSSSEVWWRTEILTFAWLPSLLFPPRRINRFYLHATINRLNIRNLKRNKTRRCSIRTTEVKVAVGGLRQFKNKLQRAVWTSEGVATGGLTDPDPPCQHYVTPAACQRCLD